MHTQDRIGMVGLGLMGLGIATNIVNKGYRLCALNHPGNQPLEALRAAGVQTLDSPQALAQACDTVLLCVNGSAQVLQVLCGHALPLNELGQWGAGGTPSEADLQAEIVQNAAAKADGLLHGLRAGMTVIDCSTSLPSVSRAVAAVLADRGVHFMDAAMTRTPNEAMQGRLNLLVGAQPQVLQAQRALLACFAENITHVGPVGSGHSLKLLHNFVSLGSVALLAEAAACADKLGIDPALWTQVLEQGGGRGVALERLSPYVLRGDCSGLRFSLANALKDLSYYTQTAQSGGSASTIAQAIQTTLAQACQTLPPQTHLPEIVTSMRGGATQASGAAG